MAGFSRTSKIEFKMDEEKLQKFLDALKQATVELEVAGAKATEAMKALKEATEVSAVKTSNAAKELNKAADKARNARPPSGGRTW